MADIIEAWDSIHDEFDVADAIVLDRVQSSLPKDITTDGNLSVWESYRAIRIFGTKDGAFELWPEELLSLLVYLKLFCGSAKLVLLPKELISSEDGEDAEDKYDEEEYSSETWDGSKQRRDLFPHSRHLID